MSSAVPGNSERKLRILLVAPALPIVGGQTVQASRLMSALAGEPGVAVEMQPINPKFLPGLQRIKYVRTVITSLKYIRDLIVKIPQYDIIHIFSASYSSFVLAPTPAVLVAKLFGKKTILNYHSGEMTDHLTTWRRTAIPTIRLFDSIVTPSEYLVDEFAKFRLVAKSVFNLVEVDIFKFRKRGPLRPVFLSNRNFESHYNVPCTLRAFRLIQEAIPEASLIVAGDGPEREAILKLAADICLKNVEFVGKLQPEDMPAVYDRADVYLNSPSIDNMPNSIIEAFACGLPVVSTDAGGIPYIVEHGRTGLLVSVDDHENLAREALRLFHENTLGDRLIAAALGEVQKYTWQNVRGEWLRTYKELAGTHAAVPI